MHALQLLHKTIIAACPCIYLKRPNALLAVTEAPLLGQRLSLTGLGRSLNSKAYVKHGIKRVDRLLGDEHLHNERVAIYLGITQRLFKSVHQPIIVVDWSELTEDQAFHLLRASVPVGGQTLTVYEEVHPRRKMENRKVHQRFLHSLRRLIPSSCHPIIVTDAGFRTTWFDVRDKMQWDYVGRVRNRTFVKRCDSSVWKPCKSLYKQATPQALYVGCYQLNHSNPMTGYLYLVKKRSKGRHKWNVDGTITKSGYSNKIAKRQHEPWLLVTSLGGGQTLAQSIISVYKTRMQIEEGFRDLKSSRFGFNIKESLTRNKFRLEILLLIGFLATYCLWLLGVVAERQQYHLRYQSNTTKTRRVLSVIFLAAQLVKKDASILSAFKQHDIKTIHESAKTNYDYACFT